MTGPDTWTERAAICGDCGKTGEPAWWSPVWGLHLCFICRARRTEAEVQKVLAAEGKKELDPEPAVVLL